MLRWWSSGPDSVWSLIGPTCVVELKHNLNEHFEVAHSVDEADLQHPLREVIDREALVLNIFDGSFVERVVHEVRSIFFLNVLSCDLIILEPGVEESAAEVQDPVVDVVVLNCVFQGAFLFSVKFCVRFWNRVKEFVGRLNLDAVLALDDSFIAFLLRPVHLTSRFKPSILFCPLDPFTLEEEIRALGIPVLVIVYTDLVLDINKSVKQPLMEFVLINEVLFLQNHILQDVFNPLVDSVCKRSEHLLI